MRGAEEAKFGGGGVEMSNRKRVRRLYSSQGVKEYSFYASYPRAGIVQKDLKACISQAPFLK
jgi:hypothetical protein